MCPRAYDLMSGFACALWYADGMNRSQEKELIDQIVRHLVQACPRRYPTSESEDKAQQLVRIYLEEAGLRTEFHSFSFNASAAANVALHFGLGTVGTVLGGVAPRLAFALHAGSALSYYAESMHRGYLLRRLFPHRPCRNVLGVLPSHKEPRLRVVFMAHTDAAFTGLIFDSRVVQAISHRLPPGLGWLHRPLSLATRAHVALSGIDLLRSVVGPLAFPLRPLEFLLTLPSAAVFLASLEVALRNGVVPGANDNLSGVAALPVLARRLAEDQPEDVEFVFVSTAAEEAMMGGADALARHVESSWDKAKTVLIVLDTLSLGSLRFLDPEGQIGPLPVPFWLRETVEAAAASEARFHDVQAFRPPVGGTDAAPFLARGWDAVALTCIDPSLGSARHYHQMTDDPDHLDLDQVLHAVDFAEALARRIVRDRSRAQ